MRTLTHVLLSCVLFLGLYTPVVKAYDRDEWLPGWSDFDRDCQSTRHELLIQFSLAPLKYKPSRRGQCVVLEGLWLDPYTGRYYTKATEVDIEHIVPLSWADAHGGDKWPRSLKRRFAEDPENLWVVSARYNRQKGDQGPNEWMPPYLPTKKIYVQRFLALVDRYGLILSPSERIIINRLAGI